MHKTKWAMTIDTTNMCSHLQKKLFEEDGVYHRLWMAMQDDPELIPRPLKDRRWRRRYLDNENTTKNTNPVYRHRRSGRCCNDVDWPNWCIMGRRATAGDVAWQDAVARCLFQGLHSIGLCFAGGEWSHPISGSNPTVQETPFRSIRCPRLRHHSDALDCPWVVGMGFQRLEQYLFRSRFGWSCIGCN